MTFEEIKIGKQVWMRHNLNVETFRNGDPIPHTETDKEWDEAGKKHKPAWCYYDNDPESSEVYGKLYNWWAVIDPRGLAPMGWKIPSDYEWSMLIKYLGGEDDAGVKLMSIEGWSDNNNGTNESGFSALPGGRRAYNGVFFYSGNFAYWWSSSIDHQGRDLRFPLNYYCDGENVVKDALNQGSGLSVRCLRTRFDFTPGVLILKLKQLVLDK